MKHTYRVPIYSLALILLLMQGCTINSESSQSGPSTAEAKSSPQSSSSMELSSEQSHSAGTMCHTELGARNKWNCSIFSDFERFDITVYDHDTGPEFDTFNNAPMVIKGMVQDTLDPNGRPVFKAIPGMNNGCTECGWFNQNIDEWWSEEHAVAVYFAVLKFEHQGIGEYRYENSDFYPLNEYVSHEGSNASRDVITGVVPAALNYSFTVHMQRVFEYDTCANQKFIFNATDDIFVFLNGHLVIDKGGINTPEEQSFVLSEEVAKLGLAHGDQIYFDIFTAHRTDHDSQLTLTTSIPCYLD